MGNAFTAIADDEQAIFYNPAGLAGVRNFSFNLLSLNVEASNDLVENLSALMQSFSNPGISSAGVLMGKNLSGRVQATSTFLVPNFGIAAIVDQQVYSRLKNLALPSGVYGAQTTYGIQAGFGIPIKKFKRKKGELRVGIAGKVLWRAGGSVRPTVTQIMSVDTTSLSGNMTEFGTGLGLDAGLQYYRAFKKKYSLQAGLAFKDIGDTSFTSGANFQPSNLTFGVAGTYKYADLKATLSYDYSNILTSMAWMKKNHLGLELKFPLLSLYGGLNQIYFTYGAGIDLGLVKVMYTSYAEEMGAVTGLDAERRHLLYVTVKLDP
jgi:hypothetical protein